MSNHKLNRRTMLKTMGLAAVGSTFLSHISCRGPGSPQEDFSNTDFVTPTRPLTAIVLGAGNRGNVYASYAQKSPKEIKIVGVAEPIARRNEHMAKTHGIEDKHRWVTWEHAFEIPKFADAVIITTPDHLHYGPAMKALKMGYDVLLEKPIAQSWQQCSNILSQARKYKRIVAVCHVLRYTPYFRKIKHEIDSGRIGQIMSVQLLEPVLHIHMAHSYVRGIWRKTAETNPMILAKSCHDLDILRWLTGKSCKRISSFGSLKLFKPENAPKGSTMRCTDGCRIEPQCPYSALRIYLQNKMYLSHLNLQDHSDKTILKALKEGQYGRCVYRCDNDVVDHQVAIMEFDEQITATFSMEAFTHYIGRRIKVFGTMGDIIGDWEKVITTDFRNSTTENWNVKENVPDTSGHGGGDDNLMRDFVQAVTRKDVSLLTSTLDASMESHLMGFMAEESRLSGKTLDVDIRI